MTGLNYTNVEALIDTAPDLSTCCLTDREVQTWLAQVHRVIQAHDPLEAARARVVMDNLGNNLLRSLKAQTIMNSLHRALVQMEPNVRAGAFIPQGNLFEAFVQITAIFQSASSEVFVIDPYMDERCSAATGAALQKEQLFGCWPPKPNTRQSSSPLCLPGNRRFRSHGLWRRDWLGGESSTTASSWSTGMLFGSLLSRSKTSPRTHQRR